MNLNDTALLCIIGLLAFGVIFMWQFLSSSMKEARSYLDKLEKRETELFDLKKELEDAKKNAKLSNDVISVLHKMKQNGAVIRVEVIDESDIFYHNGGQYR
jgi:biopolymer transport protein ExbB/TolQ